MTATSKFFLRTAGICAAAIFAVIFCLTGGGVMLYPLWLVCMSVVTFGFYWFDKRRSMEGGWRVPESVLHIMSLCGGFAGAYLGRRVFRHKTQKTVFIVIIVLSAVMHIGFYVWFLI